MTRCCDNSATDACLSSCFGGTKLRCLRQEPPLCRRARGTRFRRCLQTDAPCLRSPAGSAAQACNGLRLDEPVPSTSGRGDCSTPMRVMICQPLPSASPPKRRHGPAAKKIRARSREAEDVTPGRRSLLVACASIAGRFSNLSPQELDHKAAQIVDVDRLVPDSHGPHSWRDGAAVVAKAVINTLAQRKVWPRLGRHRAAPARSARPTGRDQGRRTHSGSTSHQACP